MAAAILLGLMASAESAAQALRPPVCLAPGQVADRDGDFRRHRAALSDPRLCIERVSFTEGGLAWAIEVVRNRMKPGPLWAVPHDNEKVAWASALHAVGRHGGTMVAVDTGGTRLNGAQDPNRNFGPWPCPERHAPSPLFTSAFLTRAEGDRPIIGLHSNDPGYAGPGQVSIRNPEANGIAFPAARPIGRSPDDTVVYLSSTRPPDADPGQMEKVRALNSLGINVIYEVVSPQSNDCSFAHFAALAGIPRYYNVEVVHGDAATQQRIVELLVRGGF